MIDDSTNSHIISDKLKTKVTVRRRPNNGIVISSQRSFIALTDQEIGRLLEFIEDIDGAPQLGQMQVFTA